MTTALFQKWQMVRMAAIAVILTAASSSLSAGINLNLRDAFKVMPDSIVPYLSENNRLDFIDFMDSGMDAVVTNAFGGQSRMTALKRDSLSIQLSEASKLDMMLFTIIGDPIDSCQQVIALIYTYGSEPSQYESTIHFYSAAWRRLRQDLPFSPNAMQKLEAFNRLTILKWYDKVINKD